MATEDELKKIYADALKQQTDQINQQQQATNQQLDKRKEENHQTVQRNLNRTAAEADKAAANMAELHSAYGLTSGGRAQARLSQSNQTAADMTSIRTAGMTADEAVEQERANLARQYANAIKAAQEANNLELAKALYAEARRKENELNAQKQKNAQLMASAGDYGLYGELNGLTPEQVAKLEAAYVEAHAPKPSYAGGGSGGSGGSSNGWEPTFDGGDNTAPSYEIDMDSVRALGYDDNVDPAELIAKVRRGTLEYEVVNGKIVFREARNKNVYQSPDPNKRRPGISPTITLN